MGFIFGDCHITFGWKFSEPFARGARRLRTAHDAMETDSCQVSPMQASGPGTGRLVFFESNCLPLSVI